MYRFWQRRRQSGHLEFEEERKSLLRRLASHAFSIDQRWRRSALQTAITIASAAEAVVP